MAAEEHVGAPLVEKGSIRQAATFAGKRHFVPLLKGKREAISKMMFEKLVYAIDAGTRDQTKLSMTYTRGRPLASFT
jgi:hypothetical protein